MASPDERDDHGASEPNDGAVALMPEPFEVNAEAVSLAARAARDALQRMSAARLRRPLRREAPPAHAPEPLPSPTKAAS